MIDKLLKIALFMGAFFSFDIYSNELTPWIPPQTTTFDSWSGNGAGPSSSLSSFADDWITSSGSYPDRSYCSEPVFSIISEFKYLMQVKFINGLDGESCDSPSGANFYIYNSPEDVDECEQLDYPLPEDITGDGGIDHCHKTECSRQNEMFENPGLTSPNGYLCIAQGNGEYCEHQIGNVLNDDGTTGISIVAPTGESCGSDPSGLQSDIWEPLESDNLPDPDDPSSPPADNGDPDCTPIGGSSLNVCNSVASEVCDYSSGSELCPDGCGYVNGDFKCIFDDDGTFPPVEDELGVNDNSDIVEDDISTLGDEGTYSRLEGLLQNTDGIEGLLEGIKDAIGNIPGGGGDDGTEPTEDDPNCAGGEFYIGENCITFDKSGRPTNADIDTTAVDLSITNAENDLRAAYDVISSSLSNKFNVGLTGGSYTSNNQTIKGVDIDFSMSRISSMFGFSLWGTLFFLMASIRSFFILLGG